MSIRPTSRSTVVDASRCPSCGEANRCGVVEGRSECWCFAVNVSEQALARVPAPLLKRACLCARCASAEAVAGPEQA